MVIVQLGSSSTSLNQEDSLSCFIHIVPLHIPNSSHPTSRAFKFHDSVWVIGVECAPHWRLTQKANQFKESLVVKMTPPGLTHAQFEEFIAIRAYLRGWGDDRQESQTRATRLKPQISCLARRRMITHGLGQHNDCCSNNPKNMISLSSSMFTMSVSPGCRCTPRGRRCRLWHNHLCNPLEKARSAMVRGKSLLARQLARRHMQSCARTFRLSPTLALSKRFQTKKAEL